jgi:hypothetical protein
VHHFEVDVAGPVGIFAAEEVAPHFAQAKEIFERKFFGFVFGWFHGATVVCYKDTVITVEGQDSFWEDYK